MSPRRAPTPAEHHEQYGALQNGQRTCWLPAFLDVKRCPCLLGSDPPDIAVARRGRRPARLPEEIPQIDSSWQCPSARRHLGDGGTVYARKGKARLEPVVDVGRRRVAETDGEGGSPIAPRAGVQAMTPFWNSFIRTSECENPTRRRSESHTSRRHWIRTALGWRRDFVRSGLHRPVDNAAPEPRDLAAVGLPVG